jgi:DUF4097 and DUF4098 domain-containing protein YvlB
MRTSVKLGLVALLAMAAFAAEPALKREGPFWVEVEKGSEPVAVHGSVRIRTNGGVSVKGAAGNQLSYSMVTRVKAGTEAEARRLLGAYHVRAYRSGQSTYLVAQAGSEMAELEVTAPQTASEVVIETRAGAVDASQFEGVLKAETGGGRVTLDQISGDVVAKTCGGDVVLGKIGGDVRSVSGGGHIQAESIHGEAFFETAGGDIVVQQVDGPVHCSTAAGGIHIAQAGNIVIADTAGGPIDVGYAKGMVTAKNSSGGPIQVHSGSGATCESAGGAINLTSAGGSLKAETAVGSIIARFQTQPVADSFLSTSAGDITVWIPSNLKVTVRAQNASYGGPRRIVSEFPDIAVKAAGFATIAEGALNGGGPLVRIAGSGGMIYIRRDQK